MQVVNDGGLVQMCQLGHVASLVELGWVDFVDSIFLDFLLCPIVALYQQFPAWHLFYNPSANEGVFGVVQPDIALAREVVLAFYNPPRFCDVRSVF
jgi:hypothetical protein